MSAAPVVEILFLDGCPNTDRARELVERVAYLLGINPDLRLVNVETAADAQRLGFLGSPTIRVNGRDVEPGADQRHDFAHACRIYRTAEGMKRQPDPIWLRAALNAARGN
jgi:hypothetical protein